jgi:hypothetical protein
MGPAVDADSLGMSSSSRPVGWQNPWMLAIAVVSGVLIVGGAITVAVGLADLAHYDNTVLGQDVHFDAAVATAIVGGAAILLGVLVGTCCLVLGAVGWDRRH